ncbi:hypothetical protein MCOR25_010904 [Pyricularia grisea]|nr:hypothetical protein MCOR25_010904 [Pyricularia grisea]
MPNFTTTTDSDRMTANVLMMGLTQSYLKFLGRHRLRSPLDHPFGQQERLGSPSRQAPNHGCFASAADFDALRVYL